MEKKFAWVNCVARTRDQYITIYSTNNVIKKFTNAWQAPNVLKHLMYIVHW